MGRRKPYMVKVNSVNWICCFRVCRRLVSEVRRRYLDTSVRFHPIIGVQLRLQSNAQCGNARIFLAFSFSVKTILFILEVTTQKGSFNSFLRLLFHGKNFEI